MSTEFPLPSKALQTTIRLRAASVGSTMMSKRRVRRSPSTRFIPVALRWKSRTLESVGVEMATATEEPQQTQQLSILRIKRKRTRQPTPLDALGQSHRLGS